MAQNLYSLGFEAGGPSPQELDLLPTRLAQAAGIQKGTVAQATGAIDGILLPVQATALQASDQIQGAIDGALEYPRDVQLGTYQAVLAAIDEILAPLRSDYQKNQPAPPKRKRRSKTSPDGAPADVQPVPPGLPPGCHWYQYPPGRTGPPRIVCPTLPPPVPITEPPSQGQLYWLVYHCELLEAAGVPCATQAQQQQLLSEGWCPWGEQSQWQIFGDATAVTAYLTAQLPRIEPYCLLGPAACPFQPEPAPVGPGWPTCP